MLHGDSVFHRLAQSVTLRDIQSPIVIKDVDGEVKESELLKWCAERHGRVSPPAVLLTELHSRDSDLAWGADWPWAVYFPDKAITAYFAVEGIDREHTLADLLDDSSDRLAEVGHSSFVAADTPFLQLLNDPPKALIDGVLIVLDGNEWTGVVRLDNLMFPAAKMCFLSLIMGLEEAALDLLQLAPSNFDRLKGGRKEKAWAELKKRSGHNPKQDEADLPSSYEQLVKRQLRANRLPRPCDDEMLNKWAQLLKEPSKERALHILSSRDTGRMGKLVTVFTKCMDDIKYWNTQCKFSEAFYLGDEPDPVPPPESLSKWHDTSDTKILKELSAVYSDFADLQANEVDPFGAHLNKLSMLLAGSEDVLPSLLIDCTYLCDKGTMLRKSGLLDSWAEYEIKRVFDEAEKLRNACAHVGFRSSNMPFSSIEEVKVFLDDVASLTDSMREQSARMLRDRGLAPSAE